MRQAGMSIFGLEGTTGRHENKFAPVNLHRNHPLLPVQVGFYLLMEDSAWLSPGFTARYDQHVKITIHGTSGA